MCWRGILFQIGKAPAFQVIALYLPIIIPAGPAKGFSPHPSTRYTFETKNTKIDITYLGNFNIFKKNCPKQNFWKNFHFYQNMRQKEWKKCVRLKIRIFAYEYCPKLPNFSHISKAIALQRTWEPLLWVFPLLWTAVRRPWTCHHPPVPSRTYNVSPATSPPYLYEPNRKRNRTKTKIRNQILREYPPQSAKTLRQTW